MTTMLAIGQAAFAVHAGPYGESWITCPDCLGQRALTVILGDGSRVSIACDGRTRGFLGPTGQVLVHGFEAHMQSGVITAIEMDGEGVRYRLDGSSSPYIFATAEEAQAKVAELYAANEAEEAAKPTKKAQPHQKWAWHVYYHRNEIRRQEKSIEYHKAALAVAKQKAHVPEEPR